jgi:hypothetical protein
MMPPQIAPAKADITIRPQQEMWLVTPIVLLTLAIFSIAMLLQEVRLIWWLPPVSLLLVVLFLRLLRTPTRLVFMARDKTLEVSYRCGGFFKSNQRYKPQDIESIRSRTTLMGDNDATIVLELLLHSRKRVTVGTGSPNWDPSGPPFGISGCRETEEIQVLRQDVASLMGIRDEGFVGPCHD